MTRRIGLALAALTMILAGCGHSAPTTLHAIAAIPPAGALAYAGPPVRVDGVKLPPAIDRIDLLRETGVGRYQVLEFDRWAAPPARLARQALAEDLSLRLPPGAVIATSSADGPSVVAVAVDILSFSATPDGAVLTANWTHGCRPGDVARRYVRLDAPGGDAPAALAALMGQLADRIAADLAASPGACPPPRPAQPAQPAIRSASSRE